MPRGVPWDQYPNEYIDQKRKEELEAEKAEKKRQQELEAQNTVRPFDPIKDANIIGKRVLFGAVVSFIHSCILKPPSKAFLFPLFIQVWKLDWSLLWLCGSATKS